jgi:hypothetical protein
MPKQFVSRWLLDMLEDGPYRDEREVKAEQRQIRANAKSEVDRIWAKAEKDLAPPPVAPLPPPDWGMAAPPPSMPAPEPMLPPAPPSGDPGIGAVSALAESPADYWGGSPAQRLGEIETIA